MLDKEPCDCSRAAILCHGSLNHLSTRRAVLLLLLIFIILRQRNEGYILLHHSMKCRQPRLCWCQAPWSRWVKNVDCFINGEYHGVWAGDPGVTMVLYRARGARVNQIVHQA